MPEITIAEVDRGFLMVRQDADGIARLDLGGGSIAIARSPVGLSRREGRAWALGVIATRWRLDPTPAGVYFHFVNLTEGVATLVSGDWWEPGIGWVIVDNGAITERAPDSLGEGDDKAAS